MASRLLVVGGGIAGFGLLRAVSLQGMSCTLVERHNEHFDILREPALGKLPK